MAGQMYGADIAELRRLAGELSAAAEIVTHTAARLNSQIESTTAWVGNDANVFRSDWSSQHMMVLTRVSTLLSTAAKRAQANADEQEVASSNDGGVSSGIGGSALGGVVGGAGSLGSHPSTSALADFLRTGKASTEASAEISRQVSGRIDFESGGLRADLSGEAKAGISLEGNASVEVGMDGLKADLGGRAHAGAETSIQTSLDLGLLHMASDAKASVGATAEGSAGASLGPDGLSAKFGVEAMVAAEARANAEINVGGLKANAGAYAMAGIGVRADGEFHANLDKVGFSVDVGASLGLGAGVSLDLSFSPKEVAQNIGNFANSSAKAAEKFLENLGW